MPDAAPAAVALLDRLTSFLRASFTYEGRHRRVAEMRAALSTALSERREDPLRLSIDETTLQLGGVPFAAGDARAAWLHRTLLQAALGVVEFRRGVDEAALQDFAEALRTAFGQRPRSFEDCWLRELPGLAFGPMEMIVLFDATNGDGGDGDDGEAGEDFAPRATPLRAMLSADDTLRTRLESLRHDVGDRVQDGERTVRVDLLELIERALPAEAHADAELARSLVHQVLDSVEGRLGPLLQRGRSGVPDRLAQQMVQVGLQIFRARTGVSEAPALEELPEGRPGDERIVDDPARMLEEYAALPPLLGQPLDGAGAPPREMFGVYLLGLRMAQAASTRANAEAGLHSVLAAAPELAALLAPVCERCLRNEDPSESDWRVLDFALGLEEPSTLDLPDWREPALLDAAFPRLLGRLLEASGAGDELALERLLELCRRRGADGILAEREFLLANEGLAQPARRAVLERVDDPALLPLYRLLVEVALPEQFDEFARRLGRRPLPAAALGALRGVSPAARLEREYLIALCAPDPGPEELEALALLSSAALRRELESRLEAEGDRDRRVFLVRLLQAHPEYENLEFLRMVHKGASGAWWSRGDKAFARAVGEALEGMQRTLRARRR